MGAADRSLAGAGPDQPSRLVAATTAAAALPVASIWSLTTNLPRPGSPRAADAPLPPASLAEVVRLYGLRMWMEQGDKQVKQERGWADWQARTDRAIRRHWALVRCAFTFCWWAWSRAADGRAAPTGTTTADQPAPVANAGRGGNVAVGLPARRAPERVVARGAAPGAGLAAPVDYALVARLVRAAPAPAAAGAA